MSEIPSPPSESKPIQSLFFFPSAGRVGGREGGRRVKRKRKGSGKHRKKLLFSLATSPKSKDNAAKVRYQDNCLKGKHSDFNYRLTQIHLHKML